MNIQTKKISKPYDKKIITNQKYHKIFSEYMLFMIESTIDWFKNILKCNGLTSNKMEIKIFNKCLQLHLKNNFIDSENMPLIASACILLAYKDNFTVEYLYSYNDKLYSIQKLEEALKMVKTLLFI